MQRLFSHVDLRVRSVAAVLKFYDAFLAEFGFIRVIEAPFTEEEPTWRREHWRANDEFIGLTADPEFMPNEKPHRVSRDLARAGRSDHARLTPGWCARRRWVGRLSRLLRDVFRGP